MTVMSFTSYVLMIVVDPATRSAVGLTKKKGPAFLIDKLNFPGGKLEAGETPEVAASRELREETGVHVDEAAWIQALYCGDDTYELHVLAACSADVHSARTLEEEPVEVLDLDLHTRRAAEQPDQYPPDFLQVLNAAKVALHIA